MAWTVMGYNVLGYMDRTDQFFVASGYEFKHVPSANQKRSCGIISRINVPSELKTTGIHTHFEYLCCTTCIDNANTPCCCSSLRFHEFKMISHTPWDDLLRERVFK